MDKQISVYEPTEQVKMEVKTDGETVWLTIDQMAMLFGRDKSVIGKHVRNVFAEGELPEEGFRQILPKTSVVGGRCRATRSALARNPAKPRLRPTVGRSSHSERNLSVCAVFAGFANTARNFGIIPLSRVRPGP